MTKKNAIKRLTVIHKLGGLIGLELEDRQALSMGIDALEQEPCEDAISRKAVLEWIKGSLKQYANTYSNDMLNMWMLFEEQIKAMPPVTPNSSKMEQVEQEPFINKPCVSSGVCEHDKNKVLDKIRAEMELIKEAEYQIYGKGSWRFVDKCLDIIDKYRKGGVTHE